MYKLNWERLKPSKKKTKTKTKKTKQVKPWKYRGFATSSAIVLRTRSPFLLSSLDPWAETRQISKELGYGGDDDVMVDGNIWGEMS